MVLRSAWPRRVWISLRLTFLSISLVANECLNEWHEILFPGIFSFLLYFLKSQQTDSLLSFCPKVSGLWEMNTYFSFVVLFPIVQVWGSGFFSNFKYSESWFWIFGKKKTSLSLLPFPIILDCHSWTSSIVRLRISASLNPVVYPISMSNFDLCFQISVFSSFSTTSNNLSTSYSSRKLICCSLSLGIYVFVWSIPSP